jgi:hypothetical protein
VHISYTITPSDHMSTGVDQAGASAAGVASDVDADAGTGTDVGGRSSSGAV